MSSLFRMQRTCDFVHYFTNTGVTSTAVVMHVLWFKRDGNCELANCSSFMVKSCCHHDINPHMQDTLQ
jgi:hypothetical protein